MTPNQPAGEKPPRTNDTAATTQRAKAQRAKAQRAKAQAAKAQAAKAPPTEVQPTEAQAAKAQRTAAGPAAAETRVRVGSVAGFLAVVPHLLGFHPSQSMVVVGLNPRRGRIMLGFRYDLPDPPDAAKSRDIAQHAATVLTQRRIKIAIAAGYGPGTLVTPVAEALRAALLGSRITLRDLLRVQDGRYWSYACQDPRCCPPDGVPFDGPAHPAAGPVTGASEPANAARSGRAGSPASASAAAAGCAGPSNAAPSGGQQCGSWQTYDQKRPSSTRSRSRSVMPARLIAARSFSATGVTKVPAPYPAAMAVVTCRLRSTAAACSAISRDFAGSGGSGRS